ncbi:hypothetical protein SELMODRAFT_418068 [Selaginella moellendorffii]|uniref:Uncharacterized protein n=1 Tax=Selaginella moellendorffii TaxID=88036 RepID=D8S4J6_SELML|nr:hypothetical protein SELMODRAFT_418068 [Selaginella moellendorffii]
MTAGLEEIPQNHVGLEQKESVSVLKDRSKWKFASRLPLLGRSTVFSTCLTNWGYVVASKADIPRSRFSHGAAMVPFSTRFISTTPRKLILEHGFNGGIVLIGNARVGKTGFLWYAPKGRKVKHYYSFTWKGKEVVIEVAESGEKAVVKAGPQSCEFAKSGTVEMVYDPMWSLGELLALNEHNFGHPVEDVKARFRKWGGIPRYVLEKLEEASQMEMVKAAGVVRNVNESLPENQSYKAFHMSMDERTYRSYGLDLASPYVSLFQLTHRLHQFIYHEQPESIRERFMTRRQIARGGRISYRQLDETGEAREAAPRDAQEN